MIGWWYLSNIITGLEKFISTRTLHRAASLYHSSVVTNLTSMLVSVSSLLVLKMAGEGPVETFADMNSFGSQPNSQEVNTFYSIDSGH